MNATLGAAATGAGLVTAPITTAGALTGSYLTGKGARAGAKALGAGETGQGIAEGRQLGRRSWRRRWCGPSVRWAEQFHSKCCRKYREGRKGQRPFAKKNLWAPVKKALDSTVPMTAEQQVVRDAAAAKPIEGASVPIKQTRILIPANTRRVFCREQQAR